MHRSRYLVAVLVVASLGVLTGTAGAASPPEPPVFPIGVWQQPSYSFAKWKARGVNTAVGLQLLSGTVPFATWRRDLEREGMFAVREPHGDVAADATDPRLLAFKLPDEPDLRSRVIDPATISAMAGAWKAAAPDVPVWLNFSGGEIYSAAHTRERYQQWIESADWISNDFYPVTGWGRPAWLERTASQSDPPLGRILDRLATWSGDRMQWQIVETSNQRLSWVPDPRSVTPDELRGSVWHAIVHGARGIVYFPQALTPFSFDAVTTDVAAEMTRINAQLTEQAAVLAAPGYREEVAPPFERAVRISGGRVHRITLNFSRQPAELDGRTYEPYEVTLTSAAAETPVETPPPADEPATPVEAPPPADEPASPSPSSPPLATTPARSTVPNAPRPIAPAPSPASPVMAPPPAPASPTTPAAPGRAKPKRSKKSAAAGRRSRRVKRLRKRSRCILKHKTKRQRRRACSARRRAMAARRASRRARRERNR